MPNTKLARGYRHEKDKFGIAGLTPVASQSVLPVRVLECPVQLEGVVEGTHQLAENDPDVRGRIVVFEVRIQRVHAEQSILMHGDANRIDPDLWRPLIMSFQRFYGLSPGQVHESDLGRIPEAMYRSPDVDRARAVASAIA